MMRVTSGGCLGTAALAAALALSAPGARAEVRTWAQPKEAVRDAEYALTANGKSVEVIALSAPKPSDCYLPADKCFGYSYALFEADEGEEVTFAVTTKTRILYKADVRSLSPSLEKLRLKGRNDVLFRAKAPFRAVLQPYGSSRKDALVICCSTPDPHPCRPGDPGVKYFGPGLHRVTSTELASGETLYLDRGAVLEGLVWGCGTNIAVRGRGVISGAPWGWAAKKDAVRPKTGHPYHLVHLGGRNLTVEGVTLQDAGSWMLVFDRAEDVAVKGVNVFGGRTINDDGIDLCRTKRATVTDAFIRTQDDCIAVKWSCDGVTVRDSTLWTDYANCVRIGFECEKGGALRNLLFDRCALWHRSLVPTAPDDFWAHVAFVIEASNGCTVENAAFSNIVTHYPAPGDLFLVAKTLPIVVKHWNFDFREPGFIRGLSLKDLAIPGEPQPIGLFAADAAHPIENVSFRSVHGYRPVLKGAVRNVTHADDVKVTIRPGERGVDVPSDLYGAFFEDFSFGADGGLYPELVANGGFNLPEAHLRGWTEDFRGGAAARVSVQYGRPVHPNTAAHARIESFGGGAAGLRNAGYNGGIALKEGAAYDLSFRARALGGYAGAVEARLESAGRTLGSWTVPCGELSACAGGDALDPALPDWKRHAFAFVSPVTCTNATLSLLLTAAGAVELEDVSLYPRDTYKGRPRGLRRDMAELVGEMRPSFLRFPGGCVLEGTNFTTWLDWKRTVGPLERRSAEKGLWSWIQTFGLGYFEYFQWCEDAGMRPLPVVIAGVTCQCRPKERVCPEAGIDYFVKNALDLIAFATDAPDTEWGAVRAAMGHPAPFALDMIGVGNENWGDEFLARAWKIEQAVRAKYPKVRVIRSLGAGVDSPEWRKSMAFYNAKDAGGEPGIGDEHYYPTPEQCLAYADRYDAYDRRGQRIFVGEYACRLATRTFDKVGSLETALCEAALMTGFERNADVVRMAAFAPMFHRDGYRGGFFPSMIHFDGLSAWGRTSYHVQKLFRANLPARTVPCGWNRRADAKIADFFVACGEDGATGELIVKLVNVTCDARRLDVDFGAERPSGRVARTVLAGARDAENTAAHPAACVPKRDDFAFAGGRTWRTTLPAWSLTILRFPGVRGRDALGH